MEWCTQELLFKATQGFRQLQGQPGTLQILFRIQQKSFPPGTAVPWLNVFTSNEGSPLQAILIVPQTVTICSEQMTGQKDVKL